MTIRVREVQLQSILQEVSCEIGGGITLLIGQTGAGKSTLLDLLTGLQSPTSGQVEYEGVQLWDGKRMNRELQNSIGVVFQSPEQQLFARTVEAEFAYSLKPLRLPRAEVARRTRQALVEMGLSEEILPQSPLVLSGGQKRRVALGTTLAVDPRWLFLDEPTAGLDPQSTERLVEWCKSWAERRTDGGLVIVTHDLDAFFPIADRVLVLRGGRLLAQTTPEELCARPEMLVRAGIGLPASLQAAASLRGAGFELPQGVLSAEALADVIVGQLEQREVSGEVGVRRVVSAVEATNATEVVESGPDNYPQDSTPPAEPAPAPLIYRLDPRGKWVFYVALSIGLLMQSTWLGLFIGTLLTLAVLLVSQASYPELLRVTKPFLYFLIFSVLLSGLQFSGGIGFNLESAAYTFAQVYQVLLVLILGVLLSATTGQLRMKRALEQALAPLTRLRLPVEAFALAVSLMLRFIPVILRELQRFSRITRARGRSNAALGGLRVRDIPVLVIPLLLSVLQLGEDLSMAMEARGYGSFGNRRTSSMHLKLRLADLWTMLLGLLLLLALTVFDIYWH
ncbi:ATP-binding cassette domain-containing protein [Tumebacillus permanentifrigoris]|uniref:Energy-coupling factor transport system ATP-binding protein n=1 Tax=Tumebacillus permanentifrigoris TaxID=378543 RepID=A0A316DA16_9BACL|nr:ATP-binding cassette domain-containing protein [Tumebacillus permanentifrigoris]PWK13074.1 energy-coupling factor transport system ATP-binding protein [Tumebacillus permanentifrigoris]